MTLKGIKYIAASMLALPMLTGCLDEQLASSGATADQVAESDMSTLSRAIVSYMGTMDHYDEDYDNAAIGYPGMMIWRDVMTGDFTLNDNTYTYYSYYPENQYIGDYTIQMNIWDFHYFLIQKCNLLFGVIDPNDEESYDDYGNALVYRAMIYFDLTRWYEFKHTGVAWLDSEAENLGVYKLTVPIVTENTTEAEGRNNPRAPFYTMYRFIHNDLSIAERVLANTRDVATKNYASIGTVYGMMARFWLELGTRFTIYPEDLSAQVEHETDEALAGYAQLGINTAADCFRLAADYARKAINQGYTPVTKSEWYNTKTGFNSANNSWMFALIYGSDDEAVKSYTWASWVSYMCPEAMYGVANYDYKAGRCIDARLLSGIPDADWRRLTWVDPADINSQSAYNEKYAANTSLSYANWRATGAYVGYKFRPGSGDGNTSTVGNMVDIPLMRVEEMYFIEAEALTRLNGVQAGKDRLESFMNTYRYDTSVGRYSSDANDVDGMIDDILTQKRIEFWGEGIIAWDYKRLEKAIIRGYSGTNHYEISRRNSNDGYAAPWLNMYITSLEYNMNQAVIRNPDPSNAIDQWSE